MRAWLAAHTPISTSLLGGPDFAAVLALRMRAWAVPDETAYVRLLEADPAESIRLQCEVAVPETWLFRYRASYEFLRTRLQARRAAGAARLVALCAPCAAGAEAFSIAATAAAAGWPAGAISVDAIDLSPELVARARNGRARGAALRDGMPVWAEPWFERAADDEVALRPELLERIRFRAGDLLTTELPSAPYDLVLCRNLAIYLSESAQRRLIERLAAAMSDEALLLVGHADTVLSLLDQFERVDPSAFAFRPRARRHERVALAPAAPKVPASGAPAGRPVDPAPAPTPSRRRPAGPGRESATLGLRESLAQATAANEPRAIEAAARAVLRAQPDDIPAMLALVEQRLPHDPAEAERLCRRIVYLDAQQERALMVLAQLADRRGGTEEADRFRRRAMRAHLAAASDRTNDGGTPAKGTGQTT